MQSAFVYRLTPGIVLASAALAFGVGLSGMVVSAIGSSEAQAADPASQPDSATLEPSASLEVSQWMVRTARLEGAAVDLITAADELNTICQSIVQSGRIQRMAELRSEVDAMNQLVISSRLATDFLAEINVAVEGQP